MKVAAFLYWNLGAAAGGAGAAAGAGAGAAGAGAGAGAAGAAAGAGSFLAAPKSSASMSTSMSVALCPPTASTGTNADLSAIPILREPHDEATAKKLRRPGSGGKGKTKRNVTETEGME